MQSSREVCTQRHIAALSGRRTAVDHRGKDGRGRPDFDGAARRQDSGDQRAGSRIKATGRHVRLAPANREAIARRRRGGRSSLYGFIFDELDAVLIQRQEWVGPIRRSGIDGQLAEIGKGLDGAIRAGAGRSRLFDPFCRQHWRRIGNGLRPGPARCVVGHRERPGLSSAGTGRGALQRSVNPVAGLNRVRNRYRIARQHLVPGIIICGSDVVGILFGAELDQSAVSRAIAIRVGAGAADADPGCRKLLIVRSAARADE